MKKKKAFPDELRCKKCESSQTYTTRDGKRICRKCGYIENLKDTK